MPFVPETPFEDIAATSALTPEEQHLLDRLRDHPKVVRLAALRLAQADDSRLRMTPRMRQTIEAIRDHMEAKGVCPSVLEIAETVGLASKSGVHRLVTSLAERGMLTWTPNQPRSIRITDPAFAPRRPPAR